MAFSIAARRWLCRMRAQSSDTRSRLPHLTHRSALRGVSPLRGLTLSAPRGREGTLPGLRASRPAMCIAFLAEWFGGGVERPEHASQVPLGRAQLAPAGGERRGIGSLLRTETTVTAAVV